MMGFPAPSDRAISWPPDTQDAAPADLKPPPQSLQPATGAPRWVERRRDQACTEFFEEQSLHCDLTRDAPRWQSILSSLPAFTLHHAMEPEARWEHSFPLRDAADPERVHPPYADEGGAVSPFVSASKVKAHREVVLQVWAEAGLEGLPADTLLPTLEADVLAEVQRLIRNEPGRPRYQVRRLTAEDVVPHERVLIGQHGLFLPDLPLGERPLLSRGHILGLYLGAWLSGARAERAYARRHPGYSAYLLEFDRPGNTGRTAALAGLGAANGVVFANTAVLPTSPAAYDRQRINASFMPFRVTLTDRTGGARCETMVALVAFDTVYGPANPTREVRVCYGEAYLPVLDAQRAGESAPAPARMKREPLEAQQAPGGEEALEVLKDTGVEHARASIEPKVKKDVARTSMTVSVPWSVSPFLSAPPRGASSLSAAPFKMNSQCASLSAIRLILEAEWRGHRLSALDISRFIRLGAQSCIRMAELQSDPAAIEMLRRVPPRRTDLLAEYGQRLRDAFGRDAAVVMRYLPGWGDRHPSSVLMGRALLLARADLRIPANASAAQIRCLDEWVAQGSCDELRGAARRLVLGYDPATQGLNLAGLALRSIPPLATCAPLRWLNLAFNELSEVAELPELADGADLNLSYNTLRVLPQLGRPLGTLRLRGNESLSAFFQGGGDLWLRALGHQVIEVGKAEQTRRVGRCTTEVVRLRTSQDEWRRLLACQLAVGRDVASSRPRMARELVQLAQAINHGLELGDIVEIAMVNEEQAVRALNLSTTKRLARLIVRHPQADGQSDLHYAQWLLAHGATREEVQAVFGPEMVSPAHQCPRPTTDPAAPLTRPAGPSALPGTSRRDRAVNKPAAAAALLRAAPADAWARLQEAGVVGIGLQSTLRAILQARRWGWLLSWGDIENISCLARRVCGRLAEMQHDGMAMALLQQLPPLASEPLAAYGKRLIARFGSRVERLRYYLTGADWLTPPPVIFEPRPPPAGASVPTVAVNGQEPGALLDAWAARGTPGEQRSTARALILGYDSAQKAISLAGLQLRSVPPLGTCGPLRWLNLSYNRIEVVRELPALVDGAVLNLSHNDLLQPPRLTQHLALLRLYGNWALSPLTSKEYVDPLRGLGHEMVEVGYRQAVRHVTPQAVRQATLLEFEDGWRRQLVGDVTMGMPPATSRGCMARTLVLKAASLGRMLTIRDLQVMAMVEDGEAHQAFALRRLDDLSALMADHPQGADSDRRYVRRLLQLGARAGDLDQVFGTAALRLARKRPHDAARVTPPSNAPSVPPTASSLPPDAAP